MQSRMTALILALMATILFYTESSELTHITADLLAADDQPELIHVEDGAIIDSIDLDDDEDEDEDHDRDEDHDDDKDEDRDEDYDDDEDDDEKTPEDRVLKRIEDAQEEIDEAEEKIAEKEDEGKNVTAAWEGLDDARSILADAEAAFADGRLDEAEELARKAKHRAMHARGKDIRSDHDAAEFGREFGHCVADADDFGEIEECRLKFEKDVMEHAFSLLPEHDRLENDELDDSIQELKTNEDEDIQEILEEFEDYNFSDLSSEEIHEIIQAAIDDPNELREKLEDLKEHSRRNKHELGIIPFRDTDDDQWYFNHVDDLDKLECVSGFTDENGNPTGEFGPGNQVLLGESLKFALSCVLDEDEISGSTSEFWAKGWARKFVNEFSEELDSDILEKIQAAMEDDGRFSEGFTRAELLALVISMLDIDLPNASEAPFTDVSLSHAYVDYIAYAKDKGLVTGDADTGQFRPDDVPVRAEVAKIITFAKELL